MKLVPCAVGWEGSGSWMYLGAETESGWFLLEDTVTSLCPQQPEGSPCAPDSVAVIPALNFTINYQRWLAGVPYAEICFGAV